MGAAAIVWANAAAIDETVAAVRLAGLELAAVGGPGRGVSAEAAHRHACQPIDDLRAALASTDAAVAVIAAAPVDTRPLASADARGLRVLSVGPFSETLGDLGALAREHAGARPADLVHLANRVRTHPASRAAAEVLQDFGTTRLVIAEAACPDHAGGLPAALFTAADAILAFAGEPELVDATGAVSIGPSGAESDHVAALLRFPDGRAGQITTTRMGPWSWRVTLLGQAGRLTIRPSGFDWIDPAGARRDEHRTGDTANAYRDVLAASVAAAIDPGGRRDPAPDWIHLHALADAAMLSARTGQPESPATVIRAMMANS